MTIIIQDPISNIHKKVKNNNNNKLVFKHLIRQTKKKKTVIYGFY